MGSRNNRSWLVAIGAVTVLSCASAQPSRQQSPGSSGVYTVEGTSRLRGTFNESNQTTRWSFEPGASREKSGLKQVSTPRGFHGTFG